MERDTDLHDVELGLDDPVLLAQLQLTAQASNTTPQAFNEQFFLSLYFFSYTYEDVQ